MDYNIITVAFGTFRKVTSIPINYKYDIGQILRITGLELPESYIVDFCNSGDATTISMVGTADGVRIPDEFLQTGKPVKAYIVLSGEDNTQTRYEITIPVNARPERTDIQPTPEEQSTIDSLIAAMNTAVEDSEENADRAGDAADRAEEAVSHYPKIENGNWYVWNPETVAYEDTGIQAEGEDGVGIQSATLNADYTLTLTFTDGTSYTTPSIRGEPGQPGQDGVSPTITVTAITGGHRVEITDAEGTTTFNVMDGQTGTTPDIQIGTVTTLPAGSDATAEITGTPEQPRLNLGIPEGQQGLPGEVTQAQLDTALANKADIITDTASGAIASFPDGAAGLPLKSLVAQIEPQQDLHGQDAPYPPGGGKNLTPYDTDFVSVANVNNYQLILNITLTAGKTYTISCKQSVTVPTSTRNTLGIRLSGGTVTYERPAENYNPTNLRHVLTYTAPSDGTYEVIFWANSPSVSVTYNEWQVEESASFTGYAPYSNECPISGWTGAEIQGMGKNLLDNSQLQSGNYNKYGIKNFLKNSTTYTYSVFGTSDGFGYSLYAGHTNTASPSPNIPVSQNGTGYLIPGNHATFTTRDDIENWEYIFFAGNGSGAGGKDVVFQIEVGSSATDYEPYQGDSISVNWQDEAGTVYGGNLAIDEDGSCKLTVDMAIVDLGTLNWNVSNGRFNTLTTISNAKGGNHADCLCSIYKSDVGAATRAVDCSICFANNGYVYIYDTTFSGDASAFKAAMDGVKLVYELATPITYTLPSVTMLSTVLGTNNIWVDTGYTTVEYRADTKKYIQKIIAQALNS